ncbi:hypothetical protein KWE21_04140 [Acinetobacter pittii]|uniref:hypothetical protein n=1 Tax=Acinetobacter pittii TaxID=48296 RepID=UPI00355B6F82
MNKYLDKPAVQYFFLIAISILYFLGICHFFNIDLAKLRALDPNALGDFLAGSFAPLGFILLILGYTQNTQALRIQGEELKTSNEELRNSTIELRNNVEQQRLLVVAATEDLNFAKTQYANNSYKELIKSQPFIHLEANAFKWIDHDLLASNRAVNDDAKFNKIEINFEYANSRTIARELSIKILHQNSSKFDIDNRVFLPDNQIYHQNLSLNYPNIFQMGNPYVLDILFTYLDEIDQPQFQKFQIEVYRNTGKREQSIAIRRRETSFQNIQQH